MRGALPVPLWVVALVLAALAPFAARMLSSTLEQRSRNRSRRILGSRSAVTGPETRPE